MRETMPLPADSTHTNRSPLIYWIGKPTKEEYATAIHLTDTRRLARSETENALSFGRGEMMAKLNVVVNNVERNNNSKIPLENNLHLH